MKHLFFDTDLFARITGLTLTLLVFSAPTQAQVGTQLDPDSTNYGRFVSLILSDQRLGTDADSPLVAYENSTPGQRGLAVSRCFDALCKEVGTQILDPLGSSNQAGVSGRILRGADGNAVIIHLKIGVSPSIRLIRCGTSDCIGGMGPPNTSTSILPEQGQAASMDAAIGSDGFPVIAAWLQDGSTGLGLWVIKCSDPICEEETTQTQIDPNRPLSGRVMDLMIGASGFPQIAFQDRESAGSNGEVALLSCNDLACAGQDETLSVLDVLGGSVGRIIDMKINASGHPVIAYAGNFSDLRVIACNDPLCIGDDDAPNVITTLNPINQAVAMDLDSQGHPAIAAYAFSVDDLEIIFCNDPACAGDDESRADVFESDDSVISFGAWVDAVFDSDDRLQIVYQFEERVSASVFLRSLYNIRCVVDGCSLVFSDRFEAMP